MRLKRDKIVELMKKYSNGSYNQFARDLGVPAGNLHRYLTTGYGGGNRIIGAVIKFCQERGLDFEDYIEL